MIVPLKPSSLWIIGLMAACSLAQAQTTFPLKEIMPTTVEILRAQEGGVLDSVDVNVGDEVVAKQVVAKLEHVRQLHTYKVAKKRAENRSGIEMAEGEVQEKNAAFEEIKARYRRRQVSEAQVDQAEGQTKIAKAKLSQAHVNADLAQLELELAERMLEKRFFRTSINGVVIEVTKRAGEKVSEGEALVTVADISEMRAEIPMSKESAAEIGSGTHFPVTLAGTSITRIARVEAIEPLAGGKNGEQSVKIVFSNLAPHIAYKSQVCEVLLPEGIKAIQPPKEKPAPPPTKKPAASKS